MANIDNDLKEYRVPDNLMDRFQNIMTFSKNMVLKDSKYFEKYENELSKKFSRLLMKYFNETLENSDIEELINISYEYNNTVDTIFSGNDKLAKLSILYGIPKDLIPVISEEDITKITEEDINKINKSITALKSDLSFENSFANIIITNLCSLEKYKDTINGKSFEYILKILLIKGTLDTTEIVGSDEDLKKEIQNLEKFRKESLKIKIKDLELTELKSEKRSASDLEITLAENGEPLVFFDIKAKNISVNTGSAASIYAHATYSDGNITTRETKNVSLIILYKEFNTAYRELLDSEIIEYICCEDSNNLEKGFDPLITNSIKSSSQSIIRNFDNDDHLYINDFRDASGEILKTNKLFQYRYSNPYMCRRAAESDLIVYYSKDNYISNGYGLYSYQKNEIQQFIKIFKETREYFYRVLLNEAFINEKEYNMYEKTYLTFLAVLRFMNNKNDTLTDIDSYTRDDIENFLASFGFEKLSKILDTSEFLNSEIYSKALIRRYIDLMQNKGSRKVIEILQEVFSVNTTELVIYKNLLVNVKDDKSCEKYKFVKVPYTSEDILKSIKENLSTATNMEEFIENDVYWNYSDTSEELLRDELNLNVANTKYIIPEISNEFSEAYMNIRITFALYEWIMKKCSGAQEEKVKNQFYISTNYFDGPITGFTNLLRYLFYRYFKLNGVKLPFALEEYTFKLPDSIGSISIRDKYSNEQYLNEPLYEFSRKFNTLNDLVNSVSNDENINNFKKLLSSSYEINSESIEKIIGYINSLAALVSFSKLSTADDIDTYLTANPQILKNIIISLLGKNSLINDILTGGFYELRLPAPIAFTFEDIFDKLIFNSGRSIMSDSAWNEGDYDSYINNQSFSVSTELCENIEDVDSVKNAIITMCNDLIEIYDELVKYNLNISTKDTIMLKFLKTAIEYFISYTSELCNFVYGNKYSSYLDANSVNDVLKTKVGYTDLDSFYYDEYLEIGVEEDENGGKNE